MRSLLLRNGDTLKLTFVTDGDGNVVRVESERVIPREWWIDWADLTWM